MIRVMQRPQGFRVNLREMKAHIVKKIGVEKSRKYFYYFGRFLSQKLSKRDFDRSCLRLLGRDNLPLHNLLISSMFKNASYAKSPPPLHDARDPSQSSVQSAKGSSGIKNGPEAEERGFLVPNPSQTVPIWSNGVLPVSPRKVRSAMRDRRIRDRPSPLGPNGKVESLMHQSIGREDNNSKVNIENGDLGHSKYQEPWRFDHKRDVAVLQAAEIPILPGNDRGEVAVNGTVEEDREEEQARIHLSTIPLVAPLGIPFCPASVGGSRKAVPVSSMSNFLGSYGSGGLSDIESVRKRMESIAATQDLGGVSTECADVMNNMVKMYLKRLVKSCVDLVSSRSANGPPRTLSVADKTRIRNRTLNGALPGNKLQHVIQDQHSISLLDFRVAMELCPQQLGEDWPLLLERIAMRSSEE